MQRSLQKGPGFNVRTDEGRNQSGASEVRGVNITGAVDPKTRFTVTVNSNGASVAATRAGDGGAVSVSGRVNPHVDEKGWISPHPVVDARVTVTGDGVGVKEAGAFVRVQSDPNTNTSTVGVGVGVNPTGSYGKVDGQQRMQGVGVSIEQKSSPTGTSQFVGVQSSVPVGPGALIGNLQYPLNDETNGGPTGYVTYSVGTSDTPSGAFNVQYDVKPGEEKIGVYFDKKLP